MALSHILHPLCCTPRGGLAAPQLPKFHFPTFSRASDPVPTLPRDETPLLGDEDCWRKGAEPLPAAPLPRYVSRGAPSGEVYPQPLEIGQTSNPIEFCCPSQRRMRSVSQHSGSTPCFPRAPAGWGGPRRWDLASSPMDEMPPACLVPGLWLPASRGLHGARSPGLAEFCCGEEE